WTTFGFAGVYPSTLGMPAVICALLALSYRPWRYGDDPIPGLDVCLACILALMGLQMLPLPAFLIDTISPAARPVWEKLSLNVPGALPMSIDVTRTAGALLLFLGIVIFFLSARRIFNRGG